MDRSIIDSWQKEEDVDDPDAVMQLGMLEEEEGEEEKGASESYQLINIGQAAEHFLCLDNGGSGGATNQVLALANNGVNWSIVSIATTAVTESQEMVQLQDGCATLITVTKPDENTGRDSKSKSSGRALMTVVDSENNGGSSKTGSRKRLRNHYCTEPGCDRSYSSMYQLKVHMRIHTGDRPFPCVIEGCTKAFSSDYCRKAHLRTHTGEKPYFCFFIGCYKSFKTSGDLHKHIRTHTGERPFTCPVQGCYMSFTTSNIRKVHIRTHTGERPYTCNTLGCGRSFASQTNYNNHMRIHTGEKPFSCPLSTCKKRFTEYSSLYKHQWVHSQMKLHQCPFCPKTYKHLSTLSTHKRTVHGVIAADDGTEISLEQMIGVGEDGSKNFKNITSNLLGLKRDSCTLITCSKEDIDTQLFIISQDPIISEEPEGV